MIATLLMAAALAAHQADHIDEIAAPIEPTRTVVYKKVGDRELRLHIFEPVGHKATDQRVCFFTIHGGGWTAGTPRRQYPFAAHFAKLGLVGISIEYRLATNNVTVFDCVEDGRSAMRYVRARAAELGIDPHKIIANGGSAGGHIAALLDGEDTTPDAQVLYFPVIDTSKDGYGQAKIGARWRDLSPLHHVRAGLPPTIVFHGTGDKTTPFKGVQAFVDAMHKAGNRCELVVNDGGGHAYLMRTRPLYEEAVAKTEAFLRELEFLP